MALFEVTPEQAHTFRRGSEHDGAFALSLSKHADFLVVGAQVHIRGKQAERLPHADPRLIEECEKGPITQVGGRNGLKNFRHRFRLERTRLVFDLLHGLKTLHGIDLHDPMTNEPAIKGAERTVASAARGWTELTGAFEKDLNDFWGDGKQFSRDHLHKQAQIMGVGFDGVEGNGTLTKAGDQDKDGIGRWNLYWSGIVDFLSSDAKYHITTKTAHKPVE